MNKLKNEYYYDDIYPSILKFKASPFKSFFTNMMFRIVCSVARILK